MGKSFYFILVCFCFLISPPSEAKKRRKKVRKWNVSTSNGYTFWQYKKISSSTSSSGIAKRFDGQMNKFFSSIEVARNFGHYEFGGRLQLDGEAFVSPFVKLNFIKNKRRNDFVPFVILGVSPSLLTGFYARAGINLFFKRYFAFSPFVGGYFWVRTGAGSKHGNYNLHANGGFSASLYF